MIFLSAISVPAASPPNTQVAIANASNAGAGVSCNWELSNTTGGYFAMVGSKLETMWKTPPAPGYYAIQIMATGVNIEFAEAAQFVIQLT